MDNIIKNKIRINMDNIIKQIEEYQVYNVVSNVHNIEDIEEGDLLERIEEYAYYNHISDFPIEELDLNQFSVNSDKINDILGEVKKYGIESMPKIVLNENNEFIDGIHRATVLKLLGHKNIDVLIGSNKKYTPTFLKELIDEDLEIYKISNRFGSISIMENAKYSPADNSISEFIVSEEYRGLGVGTELLKEAMKQYPNLGAQVSSIASLKVFLECGFEPIDIKNKEKINLDQTSFDFKTFNKAPQLLTLNKAMFVHDIETFNNKLKESIDLFKDNGQSLYLGDKRKIEPSLNKKIKNKI